MQGALAALENDVVRLLDPAATREPPFDPPRVAERTQKMFATARSGVQRIGATVDLMLRYSREGYTRTTQPYDVFAAVRDVLAVLLPTVGHALAHDVDLVGEGLVDCVPEELNQVLTNLIENAIQALPTDGTGRLTIRGRVNDEELALTVKDNGPGIEPEHVARLFTPFFTTKGKHGGSGLGLAIARRVVTALRGSIHVQSQPGAGAAFVVRLPRSTGALYFASEPAPLPSEMSS